MRTVLIPILCCASMVTLAQTPGTQQNAPPKKQAQSATELQQELQDLKSAVAGARTTANGAKESAEKAATAVGGFGGKLTTLDTSVKAIDTRIKPLEKTTTDITTHVDRFWLLIAAALVFFMQAGFKCFEVGMVRAQHADTTAMKNLLNWLVLSAVFFVWGFGLMYGTSWRGIVGTSLFLPAKEDLGPVGPDKARFTITSESLEGLKSRLPTETWNHLKPLAAREFAGLEAFHTALLGQLGEQPATTYQAVILNEVEVKQGANPKFGLEFFLFQLAFAGTAATIVSGAMAERTGLIPYGIIALFAGGLVYPVVGHWIWGVDAHAMDINKWEATGWLKQRGFLDFAGSTVVHSVGAWISLAGIRALGPRLRRFRGKFVSYDDYKPHNLGYSVLGVFILWLGWWGFNGGSTLVYDLDVSAVILNTNIAAAFGGLSSLLWAYFFSRKQSYEMLLGGTLGGLVAVTACCNVISSSQAIAVGFTAGAFHNLADWILKKTRSDDPVGAIPVHGACGVWGTLCVAIFGNLEKIADLRHVPVSDVSRLDQAYIQMQGIGVVMVVVLSGSYLFFRLLDGLVGVRVSPDEEEHGFVVGKPSKLLEWIKKGLRSVTDRIE